MAQLLFRSVERSVFDAVSGLFTSPTGGLPVAYNVYGEDSFNNESFKPVFPYLWFMGYRVSPRTTRLPLLILDMGEQQNDPFEIGRREGTFAIATVHVYGRTRGERDDLASVIYQRLYNIPINDYDTTPATFKYNAQVEARFSGKVSVPEDVGKEGTLSNWKYVQFTFQLME
jgi:hypothetical protein